MPSKWKQRVMPKIKWVKICNGIPDRLTWLLWPLLLGCLHWREWLELRLSGPDRRSNARTDLFHSGSWTQPAIEVQNMRENVNFFPFYWAYDLSFFMISGQDFPDELTQCIFPIVRHVSYYSSCQFWRPSGCKFKIVKTASTVDRHIQPLGHKIDHFCGFPAAFMSHVEHGQAK